MKNKKKVTFWTPLLFKHIWSFNLVFFLYMGNTVKVNLQEWEGTTNCRLIPLMHTQERRNDLAWCKKIIKCLYIFIYLFIKKKKAATSHYFSAKMSFCLADSLVKMISHWDLDGIFIQLWKWLILHCCISYYIGKSSVF